MHASLSYNLNYRGNISSNDEYMYNERNSEDNYIKSSQWIILYTLSYFTIEVIEQIIRNMCIFLYRFEASIY